MTLKSKPKLAILQRSKFLIGAAVGVALLAGCAEKEDILVGERQEIRSILTNPLLAEPEQGVIAQNTPAPISLPRTSSNASWAQSPGSPQYRTTHPAMRSPVQLQWSAKIGAGDSRKSRITANPVVAQGRVFTLDSGAQVTATSTSGATLWTRDLTPSSDRAGEATGGGLAVESGVVYVSQGFGILAALDASTGAVRWSQKLDATGSGTPTVSGDLVYLTAGDDTGWAVNKSDGTVAWQIGASKNIQNVLGAPAPAVTKDLAIFAFGSGEVQAVFRRGGVGRWDATTLGRRTGRALSFVADVTSGPVVSGDTVYVGNQSGRLMALNLASGARKWAAKEGVSGPVWPIGGSVFALTDLNELVRLNASDGTRVWGIALPKFTATRPKRQSQVFAHYGPVVAGGQVLVASNDGKLRSFDPQSGALRSEVEIPGGATTAPVIAGGTLYVVSAKGELHAFR